MKCFSITCLALAFASTANSHFLDSKSESVRVPYSNATSRTLRAGSNQNLRCYDQPNESGYYVNIGTTAVPDLSRSPYNFDNRAVSCRFNGIFFLYDNYNFNPNGNVSSTKIVLITSCI